MDRCFFVGENFQKRLAMFLAAFVKFVRCTAALFEVAGLEQSPPAAHHRSIMSLAQLSNG